MECCCAAAQTETERVVIATNRVVHEDDPPSVFDAPAQEAKTSPPPPAAIPEKAPEPPPAKEAEPTAASVSTVTVNVSKDGGKKLGLEVGFHCDTIVMVENVQATGEVAAYNLANGAAAGIETGDFIISVNKVSGSAVVELLHKEAKLEIVVKKSKEITLTIPTNGKLGLDLTYQEDKEYIMVRRVVEGAVQAYNEKASAELQLNVPSRILGVDGVRGKASEMFKKLQASGSSVEFIVSQ